MDEKKGKTAREAPRIEEPPASSKRNIGLAALTVAAVTAAAYANSFSGAFVFDDLAQNVENPDLQSLWSSLHGNTRPLFFLTLFLQRSLTDLKVWPFHLVNLAIHICAALTLFGILRRTFLSERLRARYGAHALGLALVACLLWAVHPLQTESVTYIFQRTESLMGLFYLLTIYAVIRGAQGGKYWGLTAVLACALGMATKEVMITAPLAALLYGRTFLAGSFRAALKSRWRLYAGLAATWAVPLLLVATSYSFQLETGAGFGSSAAAPLEYARTQPGAILHYLFLSFWPRSLCLDYGWPAAPQAALLLGQALAVLALLILTGWGLFRNHPLGFAGAWFFLILALTSSFMPMPDPLVEHRMYLPLAALAVLVTVRADDLIHWAMDRAQLPAARRKKLAFAAGGSLAALAVLTLGCLTFLRNGDYRSEYSIWADTVRKSPRCPRAQANLGAALIKQGDHEEGAAHLREALKLKPDMVEPRYNLGVELLVRANRLRDKNLHSEAIEQLRRAVELNDNHCGAHYYLALGLLNRPAEAAEHLRKVVEKDRTGKWRPRARELLEKLAPGDQDR